MRITVCILLAAMMLFGGSPASRVQENGENCYRVIVTDTEGSPLQGAAVQFCSDTMCIMGETDEDGTAVFDAEEGIIYTVHILKVPEGCEGTEEEFTTADTYCDVTVVLQKK